MAKKKGKWFGKRTPKWLKKGGAGVGTLARLAAPVAAFAGGPAGWAAAAALAAGGSALKSGTRKQKFAYLKSTFLKSAGAGAVGLALGGLTGTTGGFTALSKLITGGPNAPVSNVPGGSYGDVGGGLDAARDASVGGSWLDIGKGLLPSVIGGGIGPAGTGTPPYAPEGGGGGGGNGDFQRAVPSGVTDPETGWQIDSVTGRPIDPATGQAVGRNWTPWIVGASVIGVSVLGYFVFRKKKAA